MFQNTYSPLIMQKFFSLIMSNYVWHDKCVTNLQLSTLFRQSNNDSEVSRNFLKLIKIKLFKKN